MIETLAEFVEKGCPCSNHRPPNELNGQKQNSNQEQNGKNGSIFSHLPKRPVYLLFVTRNASTEPGLNDLIGEWAVKPEKIKVVSRLFLSLGASRRRLVAAGSPTFTLTSVELSESMKTCADCINPKKPEH